MFISQAMWLIRISITCILKTTEVWVSSRAPLPVLHHQWVQVWLKGGFPTSGFGRRDLLCPLTEACFSAAPGPIGVGGLVDRPWVPLKLPLNNSTCLRSQGVASKLFGQPTCTRPFTTAVCGGLSFLSLFQRDGLAEFRFGNLFA